MKTYIVLNLEMCNVPNIISNQNYLLKKEIIQIGAVVLNENLCVKKQFLEYVKP